MAIFTKLGEVLHFEVCSEGKHTIVSFQDPSNGSLTLRSDDSGIWYVAAQIHYVAKSFKERRQPNFAGQTHFSKEEPAMWEGENFNSPISMYLDYASKQFALTDGANWITIKFKSIPRFAMITDLLSFVTSETSDQI